MKNTLILLSTLLFIITGCDEHNADINITSIVDTRWNLSEIINNYTGDTTNFPAEINDFSIIFQKNGKIDLPEYCNYSSGEFSLNKKDSIKIFNVGPGTEKYCSPDLAMNWETLFINSLVNAETFALNQNKLTIHSNSDYNLIFSFVEQHNSNIGRILFCTNANRMNCLFDIRLYINYTYVGALDGSSAYNQRYCQCESENDIGFMVDMMKGKYKYSAKNLLCDASNAVNSWSGEVTVAGDFCTVIFLNIFKE